MQKISTDSISSSVDHNEKATKIYRYVCELARRVDNLTADCKKSNELFSSHLEAQRTKLRDNCEKLIFTAPTLYGKKAIELMWRKVYYDPVSACKKFLEKEEDVDNCLLTHLFSGIGNFQLLMLRHVTDLGISCNGIDFLTPSHLEIFVGQSSNHVPKTANEEIQNYGQSAIYSCFIHMGDLSRYQTEMFHEFDASVAAQYYLQASQVDRSSGMPYNQLGNLYSGQNYNVDSVCYYIHCLNCAQPFDGAEGNLSRLFEKNRHLFASFQFREVEATQIEQVQDVLVQFLILVETWYMALDDSDVPKKCNMVTYNFKKCLGFPKKAFCANDFYKYQQEIEEESINPSYLNDNILLKFVQICLFCITKLKETDENKAFAAKAFTLAIFSQLLQKLLNDLLSFGLTNPATKFRRSDIPPFNKRKKDTFSEEKLIDEKIDMIKEVNGVENGHHVIQNINSSEANNETSLTSTTQLLKNQPKKSIKRRRRRRLINISESDTDQSSDDNSEQSLKSSRCSSISATSNDSDSYISELEEDSDTKTSIENIDINVDVGEAHDENPSLNNMTKLSGTSLVNEEESTKKNAIIPIDNIEETLAWTIKNNSTGTAAKGEINKVNENEVQLFLEGSNFLACLKLLQDWLLSEADLITSCGESGEPLFQSIIDIMNIFEHNFLKKEKLYSCRILDSLPAYVDKLHLEYKGIPLPEDLYLRGTDICKFDKDAAEWKSLQKITLNALDETIIRILNFRDFARQVAKLVPKIKYNRYMQVFFLKKASSIKEQKPTKISARNTKRTKEWVNSKITDSGAGGGAGACAETAEAAAGPLDVGDEVAGGGAGGGLQRRMGRLWLRSRVHELERVARARPALPALLALDAAALSHHLHYVRQLYRSSQFLLLIPTVVLQEMDEAKREAGGGGARDAIRWLEAQLQAGSRYLRTQRAHHRAAIPLLKHPKKPSRDVHTFIQILEFCYHFAAQEKHQGGNGDPDVTIAQKDPKHNSVIVLLTGSRLTELEECKEFSYLGTAASAGIPVENIRNFYAKWKKSTHKSGKKR